MPEPIRDGAAPAVLTVDLGGLPQMLREAGYRVHQWPRPGEETARFVVEVAPELEAIVTIGARPAPPAVMEAAKRLSLICCIGVGYESFDPAALAARGVRVTNAAGVNAEDVADLALCLLMAARRRLVEADAMVRAGTWPRPALQTSRNRGRKLGVLGLGDIGRAVAVRAEAIGMTVGWSGPRPKPVAWEYFAEPMALAAWADDLVIAARPTAENAGLVDAEMLDALGPRAILVNVARGSLVDEPALIAALREGRIAAAGLDVYAQEPTDPATWEGVPNLTLYPHAGGATPEALADGCALVLENLRRNFSGEPLLTPVS
jgi:lactate dehydrogenase-like 2-hydroxyacid dehydrogenase